MQLKVQSMLYSLRYAASTIPTHLEKIKHTNMYSVITNHDHTSNKMTKAKRAAIMSQ